MLGYPGDMQVLYRFLIFYSEINIKVGNLTSLRTKWIFLFFFKPLITLDSSISFTFLAEGTNTITVQVAAGNALIQDTKDIAVHGKSQELLWNTSTCLPSLLS